MMQIKEKCKTVEINTTRDKKIWIIVQSLTGVATSHHRRITKLRVVVMPRLRLRKWRYLTRLLL